MEDKFDDKEYLKYISFYWFYNDYDSLGFPNEQDKDFSVNYFSQCINNGKEYYELDFQRKKKFFNDLVDHKFIESYVAELIRISDEVSESFKG